MRQRKRDIVDSFRNGSQHRIESTKGLDLLLGQARFTGPKTLEVRLSHGDTQQVTANTIFINAGARPAKPSLPGIEGVPTLDSTSIMELDTVPARLLVVGGGYVGLEFGQMFRRFGSQVTVIQRGAYLLARDSILEWECLDSSSLLLPRRGWALDFEHFDGGRITSHGGGHLGALH